MTLRGCVSMVNGVKGPSVIRFEDVVSFFLLMVLYVFFRNFLCNPFYFNHVLFLKTMGSHILISILFICK